jgi:hypothetical protein
MSTGDIIVLIILVALFPIWATVAGVLLVAPFVVIYHVWGSWFDLLRGLWRDIKGYNK